MVSNQPNDTKWSATRISIILTIIALGLWSYSITQAEYNVGLFGLIHSLPVTFFVALGILTIASAILWVSPQNHSKLLLLQLLFLTASLWLTPLITGGSQECASTQYWYTGWSEYIVRESHINQGLFLFHNWPGPFTLLAMLSMILGLPGPYALVIDPSLMSFLVQLAYLLFVYLFLKNMLGEDQRNLCWAGLWIFGLGYWIQGAYLGPSTVGYIFLLVMLILLTRESSLPQNLRTPGRRLLSILTLACITITHLLSNFVTLGVVAMLRITKRINTTTLVIFGVVVCMTWLMYEATAFFDANVPRFVEEAFRLDIIFQRGVVERVVGSESRQAVSLTRILFSALFLAVGFLGYILSRRSKKSIYADNTAAFIALAFMAVGVILSMGAGKELFQRIFHFLLPVIAYFSVKLLYRKSTAIILCSLLVIALPLHFISHYGSEEMEYFPYSCLSASHFFADHTTEGQVISSGIVLFKHVEDYKTIYYHQLQEDKSLLTEPSNASYPLYVTIDTPAKGRLYYLYNDTYTIKNIKGLLEQSTSYSLVYTNPDVELYMRQ